MKDALAVSESGSNEGPSSEGPSSIHFPVDTETAPPGKGEAVVGFSNCSRCLQVAREQQDQQDQQDQSNDPSTPVHGYLLFTSRSVTPVECTPHANPPCDLVSCVAPRLRSS